MLRYLPIGLSFYIYFFNGPFFRIFYQSVYIYISFIFCFSLIRVCLQNALYSHFRKTSKDIKCVSPAIHQVFVSLERRRQGWLSIVCFITIEKQKRWIFSKLTCRQKTVLSDFYIHKVCQTSITHTPTQCVSMCCWWGKALCDLNWFSLNRNKISVLENLNQAQNTFIKIITASFPFYLYLLIYGQT